VLRTSREVRSSTTVWSNQHETPGRVATGVDEGDRRAIAVTDQDRLAGVVLREEHREDVQRLLVEERLGSGPIHLSFSTMPMTRRHAR
jgi:hypothetical protein